MEVVLCVPCEHGSPHQASLLERQLVMFVLKELTSVVADTVGVKAELEPVVPLVPVVPIVPIVRCGSWHSRARICLQCGSSCNWVAPPP